MDGMGSSCTSSSTVRTTMVRSRSNDVIWRDISDRPAGKARSAIPSVCARPTRNLNKIVFSAGGSSSGNEVKATSLYVVDRTAILASLMPKGDMGRPNHEREGPRHERSKCETCLLQRDSTKRRSATKTGRGAGRVARSRWCVKRTLQLDMGIVGMRPATSFSTGTPLRTPTAQRSWAVTVLCRMRQQTTARLWCITRRTVKQPVRTRRKQAWSLYLWQCSQVEPLYASTSDINKKRRGLRHGAEHGSGHLLWTLVLIWLMGQGR